jgi:hypothetical protein
MNVFITRLVASCDESQKVRAIAISRNGLFRRDAELSRQLPANWAEPLVRDRRRPKPAANIFQRARRSMFRRTGCGVQKTPSRVS